MSSSSDFTPLVETHHRRRVAFDPTINLGHVLTFVGFLITGFSAYSALDKRVTLIESQSATVVERTREQDVRLKDTLAEIKGDVKELQRSVNDVNRNLSSTPTAPARK
jgi:uncharacterized protein YycO